MPRELSYTALILKKQPFGEADEIVTMLTREEGKVRAVAKSTKLSTSKLQYALQPMFLSAVSVTGKSGLPKLIRANAVRTFLHAVSDPDRVAQWFVVAELLIKLLPDHESNEELYEAALNFLTFLDSAEPIPAARLELGLLKFKLAAMEVSGMGVHDIADYDPQKPLLFSAAKGGFYYDSAGASADAIRISQPIWRGFRDLVSSKYPGLPKAGPWVGELDRLISSFISYQLEREIKAEKFL